jgi:hypothetical protein
MAQRAYFGTGYIVSLIFAIFPFTAWVFGVVVCFQRERYLFGVIRIFFGWIIWIIDIISMILHKDLKYLA